MSDLAILKIAIEILHALEFIALAIILHAAATADNPIIGIIIGVLFLAMTFATVKTQAQRYKQ